MAADWATVEFGDLLINGTRNGVYKSKEFHGSGAKIVNMGELFANPRLHNVPMKRVELTAAELEKASLEPGDLLFARRSLVAEGAGKCSIVMEVIEPTTFESSIIRARPDPEKANSLFLYYFFNSPHGRYLLGTILRQVAVSGITGTDLLRLRIPRPDLKQQQAIACILGVLDEKIELNGRMNLALEAIAQALFKSWFVDFDPVRVLSGQIAEKPPFLSAEALRKAGFPDRFQNSELGEIPERWEARAVYDTAEFINGATFKSEDFCDPDEGLPVVKIAELKDGYTAQTKFSKRALDAKQKIDTGDLLFSWSGSPDTSLDAFLWSGGPSLLNQHIFKVVAHSAAEKRLVYYQLKYLRPTLIEIARNKQTTGLGHVTVADMKRLKICWPPSEILVAFDRAIEPIFEKAFQNSLENKNLADIREALLPKLLSGELRVPAAERIVGRCD
jgi:type I restriction enzyme S subunit